MNKRVIINYIKDTLFTSIMFLLTSGIIILYNYLKFNDTAVLLYTSILLMFMFAVFYLYEFCKYYKFNCQLERVDIESAYKLTPATQEQKNFETKLSCIEDRYIKNLNTIKLEERNKRYFFSQWIHSMKTPVSAISLMLEKFQEDPRDGMRLAEDIKGETDALYEDLEEALNLLRLEDFSKDYIPGEIELMPSLKNVINSKKNNFIYSSVYPEIVSDCSGIKVLTDKKWNEFMLAQIVSNAIKYSKVDGEDKKVQFLIEKIEDKVVLTIRDFGMGIPEYDLRRIFQPFFTGENGRKIKNSSGIGLYMVKLISEKLCNKIEVKSKVNEGTSVKITYLSKM